MGRRPLSLRMLRKSLDWNFRPGRNANVRLTSRRLVQQSVLAAGRLMYPHPPRVVAEYKSVSANIPRSRRLTPAAAAKVRGKLGLEQSLLFGKYGRGMPKDLTPQYSGFGPPLTPEFIDSLLGRLDVLGN